MRRLALFLILPAVAIGCQQAPLKVAVLASLGGEREGAQLAADQWNARGGVLGRPVTIVFKGTGRDDPQSGVGAARYVITVDHVKYIIGDVFSSLSIPISEIANDAKVIQITPTSTVNSVTVDASGATKPYVFRVCFDDATEGKLAAAFAVRNLRARKAFILEDPTIAYISELANVFFASFSELGGTVVGRATYSERDTDFATILARVRNAKPDIVYFPAVLLPIVNVVTEEARKNGITATFIGGDAWDDVSLDWQAAEGSYFTTSYRPDDPQPQAQVFRNAFRARYDEPPGLIAALSYDAMNLLLTAIHSAGTDNTNTVRAELEKASLDGVTGKITMDAHHTPPKEVVVLHVTGRKVVFVTSVAP